MFLFLFLVALACSPAQVGATKATTSKATSAKGNTISASAEILLPIGKVLNSTVCTGLWIAARDLERVAERVKGKEGGQGLKTREAMLLIAVDMKELRDKTALYAESITQAGEECMLNQQVGVIRVVPQLGKDAAAIFVYMNLTSQLDDRLERLSKIEGFPKDLQSFFKNLRDGLKARLDQAVLIVERLKAVTKVLKGIEKNILAQMEAHEKEQMLVLKKLDSVNLEDVPKEWRDIVDGLQFVSSFGVTAVKALKTVQNMTEKEPEVALKCQGEIYVITEATFLLASAAVGIHDTDGEKGGVLLQPIETVQASLDVCMKKLRKMVKMSATKQVKDDLRALHKTGGEMMKLLEGVVFAMSKIKGVAKQSEAQPAMFSPKKERQRVLNQIVALQVLGNNRLANKLYHMHRALNIEPAEIRAVAIAVRRDQKALKEGGPNALAKALVNGTHMDDKYAEVAEAARALSRLHGNIGEEEEAALLKSRDSRRKIYAAYLSPEEMELLERHHDIVVGKQNESHSAEDGEKESGTSAERRQELLTKHLDKSERERFEAHKAEEAERAARRYRLKMGKMRGHMPHESHDGVMPNHRKIIPLDKFINHKELYSGKKDSSPLTAGEFMGHASEKKSSKASKSFGFQISSADHNLPDLSGLRGSSFFVPQVMARQLSTKTKDTLINQADPDRDLDKSALEGLTRVAELHSEASAGLQVKGTLEKLQGKAVNIYKTVTEEQGKEAIQMAKDSAREGLDGVEDGLRALKEQATDYVDLAKKVASSGGLSSAIGTLKDAELGGEVGKGIGKVSGYVDLAKKLTSSGGLSSAMGTLKGAKLGGKLGQDIDRVSGYMDMAKKVVKSGNVKSAMDTIGKALGGDSYDGAKKGLAGIFKAGSFKEGLSSASGLAGSLGDKIPIFNKIDGGIDVIEKSGDAIKSIQDAFKGGSLMEGIDASGAAVGALAGVGTAIGLVIGGKKGRKIGKAMGSVSALAKGGVKSIVTAGKHVGKLFSKAASVGAAGLASIGNAAGIIGKVIGGKLGAVISAATSVVTAVMSATPLAIITGAIEGLKMLGKLIPGKIGQKIGEFAAIIGDFGISHIVGGAMEAWKMMKKGKVIDGLFHAAKKINPISIGMNLADKLGKWMGGPIGRGISKVAGAISKASDFAIDLSKKIIVAPVKAVLKGLESMSNAIFGKKATKAIKSAIKGVAKGIWKGVKGVGKAVFDSVKSTVMPLVNGVKAIGKGIGKAAKAVGKGFKKIFSW